MVKQSDESITKFQGDAEHEPLHDPAEQHAPDGHLRLVARRPRLHLQVGGQPHSGNGRGRQG